MTIDSICGIRDIRGVLFDIDGTLCDSDPLHFRAFQEALAAAGHSCRPLFFQEKISGRHNDVIAAELFPSWSLAARKSFCEDKEARFRDLVRVERLRPLPGLVDFMKLLEGKGTNIRKAAVSNAPRANAELMVSVLGLDLSFETIVVGDECERAKPFPDPYLEGMRRLGIEPRETLAFEDSPTGIKAAVAAGIRVIALTSGQSGHSAEALMAAGAYRVCKDFRDVLDR